MPMMRRGPLDRYPVEWALRQAAEHAVSGSLTFNSTTHVTVFIDEGHPYAAISDADGPLPDAPPDDPLRAEHRARARTVELLVEAVCGLGGWYFYDPLAHHPARGLWRWDTDDLLHDARARSPEVTAASMTGNRVVHLVGDQPAELTLDPDAWAVVAAMAAATTSEQIRAQLGWPPTRMLRALTRLSHLGVLDPNPPELPADQAPSGAASPSVADLDAMASVLTPAPSAAPGPPGASAADPVRPAPPPPATGEPEDPTMPPELVNPEPPAPEGLKADYGIGPNSPRSAAWTAWQTVHIPEDVPDGPLEAPADWDPGDGQAPDAAEDDSVRGKGRRKGKRKRKGGRD